LNGWLLVDASPFTRLEETSSQPAWQMITIGLPSVATCLANSCL
jgi:hypothetical protein